MLRASHRVCRNAAAALFTLFAPLILAAQTTDNAVDPVDAVQAAGNESYNRILGIIPNFQTVSDPNEKYVPLRVRDKWWLFVRETVDPYTFGSAASGAAIAQFRNDDPKYGYGFQPYMQRYGAAMADIASQNFFSDAVLAPLFREDPRYFRKGPSVSVPRRIGYALSRIVITKRDSGRESFNFSNIVGTGMGIVLSDAYYPRQSVGGGEIQSRILTSLAAGALGNLLPEFWPDIKQKWAARRKKD